MTHVWSVLSVRPSQHAYSTALLFPPPCSLTSRPPEISLLKHHLLSQAPQSLPPSPLLAPSPLWVPRPGWAWKGHCCLDSWRRVGAPEHKMWEDSQVL